MPSADLKRLVFYLSKKLLEVSYYDESGLFVYCKYHDPPVKMKEVKKKGGFHKHDKFICPVCGRVKMKKKKRRD